MANQPDPVSFGRRYLSSSRFLASCVRRALLEQVDLVLEENPFPGRGLFIFLMGGELCHLDEGEFLLLDGSDLFSEE